MSKAWEQVTPNVVNLGDLAGGLEDPQADVLGVDIRFYGIFHDIVW
jgi:hypothetical protein